MKRVVLFLYLTLLGLAINASVLIVNNTNNSGVGSLRRAIISSQSGDSIIFNSNLVSSGSDSIVLQSGINISHSLFITGLVNGTDTLFVSGGNLIQPFNVTLGSLILDSIHVKNGLSASNGGGLTFTSSDSLKIQNSSFTNCSSQGSGGSIWSNAYKTVIENSKFLNNKATSNGGGIGVLGAVLILKNTKVNGNTSLNGSGGGLSCEVDSIVIQNVIVSENTTNQKGGGIYVSTDNPILLVSNSQFNLNTSQGAGGGVYTVSGGSGSTHIDIMFSSIDSNYSNNYGGAMYSLSYGLSNINVQDSRIIGNTSWSNGAGLYCFNSNYSPSGIVLNILRSTMAFNTSLYGDMGAIGCYSHKSSTINLIKSTVTNNSAGGSGGGVFTFSETDTAILNVTNSTFVHNSAQGNGGGIMGYSVSSQLQARTIINFESSIFGLNFGTEIYNLNTPSFSSQGYNVFSSNSLAHTISTDIVGRDSTAINLSVLKNNGGFVPTKIPLFSSSAINAGNPADLSNAQNGVINGVRDAGAAEGCNIYQVDYQMACDSFTWINGQTYYQSSVGDQLVYPAQNGCDSVVVLDLTISTKVFFTDDIISCGPYTWINGITYNNSITGPVDTIVSGQGCDSIITLNLTVNGANTSIIQQADSLLALATNASFQWIDCLTGYDIPGANNSTYAPYQNGTYQVEVTQNGCVDSSICISVTNVGVHPVDLSNSIRIYPNPVVDKVNIDITNWPTNEIIINVIDVYGKLVVSKALEKTSKTETISINTINWVKGIYFIEFRDEVNLKVEKMVVP